MNLQRYCIPTICSIRKAMEHIDKYAEQFALIIRDDNSVAGVVTDGNIRRALIAGASLDDNIVDIMQQKYASCDAMLNATQALMLMEEKDYSHLPILAADARLCGVWNRKELQSKRSLPNAVVIMAGGLGTRLGALTQEVPKPMLPVAGRPILEVVLESFRNVGFHNFYFSVNYKAEMICEHFDNGSKYNCTIQYLQENKRLGTAGALSLLPEQEHDFLVVNGDILCHVNPRHMLLHHQVMQCTGTMLAKRFSMQVPYGVLETGAHGELVDIREKPSFDYCISAGMNVLSPQVLPFIPKDTFFNMPELFKDLIASGKKTRLFEIDSYWLDVGRVSDYERAQRDFA